MIDCGFYNIDFYQDFSTISINQRPITDISTIEVIEFINELKVNKLSEFEEHFGNDETDYDYEPVEQPRFIFKKNKKYAKKKREQKEQLKRYDEWESELVCRCKNANRKKNIKRNNNSYDDLF